MHNIVPVFVKPTSTSAWTILFMDANSIHTDIWLKLHVQLCSIFQLCVSSPVQGLWLTRIGVQIHIRRPLFGSLWFKSSRHLWWGMGLPVHKNPIFYAYWTTHDSWAQPLSFLPCPELALQLWATFKIENVWSIASNALHHISIRCVCRTLCLIVHACIDGGACRYCLEPTYFMRVSALSSTEFLCFVLKWSQGVLPYIYCSWVIILSMKETGLFRLAVKMHRQPLSLTWVFDWPQLLKTISTLSSIWAWS
jgi:hypothetical protein